MQKELNGDIVKLSEIDEGHIWKADNNKNKSNGEAVCYPISSIEDVEALLSRRNTVASGREIISEAENCEIFEEINEMVDVQENNSSTGRKITTKSLSLFS